MAYKAGNIVKFDVSFVTTSTGDPVDPSTVAFSYTLNGMAGASFTFNGSNTTPGTTLIAKLGTGLYEIWVDTTGMSGLLVGTWVSTGTGAASVIDSIVVTQTYGSGYTFGDLIENVARRALGAVRETVVQINEDGGMGVSDAVVTLAGPQATLITVGSILGVGLELMLVTDIEDLTFAVMRGFQGSLQTTHPNGENVYINPEYSKFDIGVAINDDLRSLSSQVNGLYRVGTAAITYIPSFQGYDLSALPSNYIDIINVRYREANSFKRFPIITEFEQANFNGLTDAQFPSGNALILKEEGYAGLPMYVTYSAPFIKLVNWEDDIINTPGVNDDAPPLNGYPTATVPNLPLTAIDIPPLGATIALVQPREISRNDMGSQDDARKAQEVPAGAVGNSTVFMAQRRVTRIDEEAQRLYNKYPNQRRY